MGLFYAILDTGYVRAESFPQVCRALIDGGADLVQLRAKRETEVQRAALLESILPEIRRSGVPLIVNDDIELALAYPDLGLHIGQDDMEPREARERLGPDRLLGWSTHNPEQGDRAIELGTVLSYFALGPVFATQTKPNYTPAGLSYVRYISGRKPAVPFFCIGGITLRNLPQVQEAGGDNVVVVSAVLQDSDIECAVKAFKVALESGPQV